jgi:hypothetical protein
MHEKAGCQNSSTCLVSLILHARTPASQNWRSLSEEIKKTVARLHTSEMVALRFERAGSLYLTPLLPHFVVGPIISTPLYRALDGIVWIPDSADTCILPNVDPNKCPSSTVSECLSINLRAEVSGSHSLLIRKEHVFTAKQGRLVKAVQRDSIFSRVSLLTDAYAGPHRL